MIDSYVYAIVALLPLSALMLMVQTSPYQALVIRGIMGAVAALVYVVVGAADVALTEALVGTMLAVTLYAVAVRSSLVMRLGLLEEVQADPDASLRQVLTPLRTVLQGHYLRLELVPYPDSDSLAQALSDKAVHGIYYPPSSGIDRGAAEPDRLDQPEAAPTLTLRIPRIYDILTAELPDHLVDIQSLPQVPPAPPLAEPLSKTLR
ncbi:hypothetical protein GFS31_12720 [Leptolyngbya sp. BL0902]|uniref:DUF4040 domain-containing protein n=1 Tax=Leptolyngbya sp. BL0902 TaxID=1115757 RepID=UPI0018E83F79|nr:DUF4040 domain-containing protein [Leptolyngbya sp. BL0902]QQE64591.1 hypothetical protein GFS31_12720 [Leptolyngbya sp. BL0902]